MKPELWEPDSNTSRGQRRSAGARDYARLLVSDIRLYHEEDVILGRIEKDIASRLGEPLARARQRYLDRHGDASIFDEEVVRILAGGDPAKLG